MQRRTYTALAIAILTTAVVLTPATTAHAASVAVVGPNVTVRPGQTAWTGSTTSANLKAAKNEFESFQVVVKSDGVNTNGVDMAMHSTLTGPGGATIANGNVTIYRAHYYNSNNGYISDADAQHASVGGATGEFADPLVPKVDPYFGEARSASFPTNIAAGRNVVGWIDVFVPAGTTAGEYNGVLRVTVNGALLADVPLKVTVADWVMPATTRLLGGMDMNINKLCAAGAHNCNNIAGGARGAAAMYARVALENRISINKPGGYPAYPDAGFDTYTAPLFTGQASPGMVAPRLAGAKITDTFVYEWAAESADEYKKQGYDKGFLNKISFYCDELNTNGTSWANCRTNYNRANTLWTGTAPANGNMPLTITSDIDAVNWAKANGYGDIADRITTLIPLNTRMHPKNDATFPGKRDDVHATALDYPEWVASGKRLWTYHSCMSMGCSANLSDTDAFWTDWASVGIDQPGSMARAASWTTYTYDTPGEYYYETVKMLPQAWTLQWDGDGGNHGDGTLFYPGCPAGCGGGPAIGGTKDVPIESIRMKRIRDSHEDYEYMMKATDLGKGADAKNIALGLFPKMYDVIRTQGQIDGARDQLIALLPTAAAPAVTCNGLAATIVGTANGETLIGTAADDVIAGLGGDDNIVGGGGNDTICGGDGYDYMRGDAGNDYINGGAGGNSVEYGHSPAAVTVDLAAGTATGEGSDTLVLIEEVFGSPYDDTLNGSANYDYLAGAGGNDTLNGKGGNDWLVGMDGNDTMLGGAGDDKYDGGAGIDTASFAGSGVGVTVTLGVTTAQATGEGNDTLVNAENVTGSPLRDFLYGDANANVINGGAGDDDLFGRAGNDTLNGGDGNDTLIGEAGDDSLTGGAGVDFVDYSAVGVGVTVNLGTGTATGDGTDTIATVEDMQGTAFRDFLTGNDGNNYIAGLGGDDDIRGGGGNDNLRGNDGHDTLWGNLGDDVLNGGAGTDFVTYDTATAAVNVNLATGAVTGGDGADSIAEVEDLGGSPYNDTLTGNAANNYIDGAAGADTINGGGGADYLSGGAGGDSITSRDSPAVAATVNCGTEVDTVTADMLDKVNADCETVNRA